MSRPPRTITGDPATDQALLALARLAIEVARTSLPASQRSPQTPRRDPE